MRYNIKLTPWSYRNYAVFGYFHKTCFRFTGTRGSDRAGRKRGTGRAERDHNPQAHVDGHTAN